jgi:amidase
MDEGNTADTALTGLITHFTLGDGPGRVAVKDCIDIAGHPTRQGSAVFADSPPAAAHARLIDNLLASGPGASWARPRCTNWPLALPG